MRIAEKQGRFLGLMLRLSAVVLAAYLGTYVVRGVELLICSAAHVEPPRWVKAERPSVARPLR